MTIPAFFTECVTRFADHVFLRENRGSGYTGLTYRKTAEEVKVFTAGLIAKGVKKGDRIAMLSESRNDWVISELAILSAGAVNVPLSVRMSEPQEILFRINHSGSRFVIVSGSQLPKIMPIRKEMKEVEQVIVLDPVDGRGMEILLADTLRKEGGKMLDINPLVVSDRSREVQPDDAANISYTSGTTADPKGIILTHRNYMVNVQQAYSLMDITPDFVTLLILPWDHAFAHTAGIFCFMGKGASVASVQQGSTPLETLKNLPGNIREIKPQLLYTVPAIARNFRKNIKKGIAAKGPFLYTIFRFGLKISELYNGLGCDRGKGWRMILKPLVMLFDQVFCSKIRAGFGGKLRYFIGGGALLDIEMQRFFYAIGIPMLQGYGLTEAAPLISANAFDRHKLGSSGLIVKDLEIRILDESGTQVKPGAAGEIVVRGGNVMAGYWMNPEATAETLKSGWLHTGDMGYVDSDGFLYVLGRFKSLLIADDGEKFSPEGMEETMVSQSSFLEQCMLYNNQHPYTIALIWPRRDALMHHLKELGLDPGSDEGIRAALEKIQAALLEYRTGKIYGQMFPQRWLPAAIGILPEGFTEENHLLNFQLKLVRSKVAERYKDLIADLYRPTGKNILHEWNVSTMKKILTG
jgi:long-chain acyl-CoA synthetase